MLTIRRVGIINNCLAEDKVPESFDVEVTNMRDLGKLYTYTISFSILLSVLDILGCLFLTKNQI